MNAESPSRGPAVTSPAGRILCALARSQISWERQQVAHLPVNTRGFTRPRSVALRLAASFFAGVELDAALTVTHAQKGRAKSDTPEQGNN